MAGSPQDYEALRNRLIEKYENLDLAQGTAQPPEVVAGHLAPGFGYGPAMRLLSDARPMGSTAESSGATRR